MPNDLTKVHSFQILCLTDCTLASIYKANIFSKECVSECPKTFSNNVAGLCIPDIAENCWICDFDHICLKCKEGFYIDVADKTKCVTCTAGNITPFSFNDGKGKLNFE